jgi:hypothetical protein
MATIKEAHDAWLKQVPATETISDDPPPPAAKTPATTVDPPATGGDPDPADTGGDTSGDNVDPPSTTADTDGETDPPEGEGDEPTPPKGSARERIEGLIDDRNALRDFGKLQQEENRRLREQLEAAAKKPTTQEAPAQKAPMKPPRMDDPEIAYDPDKFAEAQAKWIQEQIDRGVEKKLATSRANDSAAAAANEGRKIAESYVSRIDEFKKTHDDWDTLAAQPGLVEPHPAVSSEIQLSEVGPQITYTIMKDKAFRDKLFAATPQRQLKMIGVLEEKLVAEKAAGGAQPATKKPTVPQKRTTQAPPPPTRIPSGNAGDQRADDDPNLPMDDFVRRHRAKATAAREAKRARR